MRSIQVLSFLALAQVAIANPIYQHNKAKAASSSKSPAGTTNSSTTTNAPTKDSVMQAASNFAQDVGIVSNAINKMTSMTDQNSIRDTAQRAFDAESDEDNQRQILIAAAGPAGATSNRKIQQFTPTVLNGLDAITKDPSPDSVMMNTKIMEDSRNPNILPSITNLSNAALASMGLDKTQPNFQKTTGQSGSNINTSDNSSPNINTKNSNNGSNSNTGNSRNSNSNNKRNSKSNNN